jgi:hypothetical protein
MAFYNPSPSHAAGAPIRKPHGPTSLTTYDVGHFLTHPPKVPDGEKPHACVITNVSRCVSHDEADKWAK